MCTFLFSTFGGLTGPNEKTPRVAVRHGNAAESLKSLAPDHYLSFRTPVDGWDIVWITSFALSASGVLAGFMFLHKND